MSLPNPKFEASYGRLFGPNIGIDAAADPFFRRFYERFTAHEDIAQMFRNTDIERQVQMLKRSLFQLVSYYVTDQVSAELERIATVHHALALDPAAFDTWLAALLDTVQEFDDQADESTMLAWGWALAPGITYMRLALANSAD